MALHLAILLIATCLSAIYDYFDKRNSGKKYISLFILVVGLSIFIGFRSIRMGTDTPTYVISYTNNSFNFDFTEIGFPIVTYISNLLGLNYSQFFTIIAMVTMLGTIAFVHKKIKISHGVYTFLYITSFSFLYSCSATRFFCALSFIIIANYYMSIRCTKKTILYLIIAMLFHFSAVIFLPICYIAKKRLSKNFWLFSILLLVGSILLNVIGIDIFGSIIPSKYLYIIKQNYNSLGVSTIKSFIELVFLYSYRKTMEDDRDIYDYYLSLLVFSIVFDFIPGAYRSIWFLKFPTWILWGMAINKISSSAKKDKMSIFLTKSILAIAYTIWYVYMLNTMGASQNLIPYAFS